MTNSPSPQLNYAPPARRNDLREIAVRQKAIQICILGYFCTALASFVLPGPLRLLAVLVAVGAAVTGAVFVFMLAIALYNIAAGIILGLLTLIPFIGMLVLLIVNGKATKVLRKHNVKVGLLGANLSEVPVVTLSAGRPDR